ncbi:MAG TPA: GNAT family N-acetyltransferase [Bacillales bacterium]|nr:GNAT family N-acetyltransferase [Bacillales bacterium]
MCALHNKIFVTRDDDDMKEELLGRSRILILAAFDAERVVGYKIGFEDRRTRFYSWLGGVSPDYRGQGIASELMRKQHEWCKAQGYTIIRTQTKNKWRNMVILNLHHGFDIVGTYTDGKGEAKIILEKRLQAFRKEDDFGKD